jgi:hypothetical protein
VKHPHLTEKAKSVLAKNWRGKYTRPAKGLYPHQWSWNSAFISIAYTYYGQEKAEKEMLSPAVLQLDILYMMNKAVKTKLKANEKKEVGHAGWNDWTGANGNEHVPSPPAKRTQRGSF